jgi:non-ribosomal peptide synthase protein (TIGR01720 family)
LEDSLFSFATADVGTAHHPDQQRSHLLNVNAIVADGRLRVAFGYSEAVHARATVEGLAERFEQTIRGIIDAAAAQRGPLNGIDVRDADLTPEELAELLADLELER